jgi:NADH:ubiquinone oxidoreductase subunit 6 (subunit J)
MSSPSTAAPVSPASAESHKDGSGIFIALIPWLIFTVLVQHTSLKLGSAVALVAAVIIALPGIRAGRPKALELGAVATFIAFVVASLVVDHQTATDLARYARGIAAAGLALIAFASLLFVPFTEQYAREQVPEQFWGSSQFKQINRRLTAMWGLIFAAMVPFHILAGALDRPGTNVLLNWVVPIALVTWGIKQSSAAGDNPAAHELA